MIIMAVAMVVVASGSVSALTLQEGAEAARCDGCPKDLFGDNLKDVILYGSYARGDYSAQSDVDVMIIAEIEEKDIMKHVYAISEYLGEFLIDYDIVISPVVESYSRYQQYKDVIPFLKNVQREGIALVS